MTCVRCWETWSEPQWELEARATQQSRSERRQQEQVTRSRLHLAWRRLNCSPHLQLQQIVPSSWSTVDAAASAGVLRLRELTPTMTAATVDEDSSLGAGTASIAPERVWSTESLSMDELSSDRATLPDAPVVESCASFDASGMLCACAVGVASDVVSLGLDAECDAFFFFARPEEGTAGDVVVGRGERLRDEDDGGCCRRLGVEWVGGSDGCEETAGVALGGACVVSTGGRTGLLSSWLTVNRVLSPAGLVGCSATAATGATAGKAVSDRCVSFASGTLVPICGCESLADSSSLASCVGGRVG